MNTTEAVKLAIEGQRHLLYKWQGEYGAGYPQSTREFQIDSIKKTISELQDLKNEIASRMKKAGDTLMAHVDSVVSV